MDHVGATVRISHTFTHAVSRLHRFADALVGIRERGLVEPVLKRWDRYTQTNPFKLPFEMRIRNGVYLDAGNPLEFSCACRKECYRMLARALDADEPQLSKYLDLAGRYAQAASHYFWETQPSLRPSPDESARILGEVADAIFAQKPKGKSGLTGESLMRYAHELYASALHDARDPDLAAELANKAAWCNMEMGNEAGAKAGLEMFARRSFPR